MRKSVLCRTQAVKTTLSPSVLLSASMISCAPQAATTHTCGTRHVPTRYASRCRLCGAGCFAVRPVAACVHRAAISRSAGPCPPKIKNGWFCTRLTCLMLCEYRPRSVAAALANHLLWVAVPYSMRPLKAQCSLGLPLTVRLGASQRPAATVEAAAHTYDAAAMAYAAGTDTDMNFPPTPAQLETLGQPVRTAAAHLAVLCSDASLLVKLSHSAPATHPACSSWSQLIPEMLSIGHCFATGRGRASNDGDVRAAAAQPRAAAGRRCRGGLADCTGLSPLASDTILYLLSQGHGASARR